MLESGLDIQVEVKVDLVQSRLHAAFVEQRAQAFVLLAGEHDRRRVGTGRKSREGARLADQRLALEPAEVDCIGRAFAGRDGDPPPRPEVVDPLDGRQREPPGQLAAAGLRSREHGAFVEQRPRVHQLSLRLDIEHHGIGRNVVEQRRARRVEVSRIELHPRKRRPRAKPRQLVLPLRPHVAA